MNKMTEACREMREELLGRIPALHACDPGRVANGRIDPALVSQAVARLNGFGVEGIEFFDPKITSLEGGACSAVTLAVAQNVALGMTPEEAIKGLNYHLKRNNGETRLQLRSLQAAFNAFRLTGEASKIEPMARYFGFNITGNSDLELVRMVDEADNERGENKGHTELVMRRDGKENFFDYNLALFDVTGIPDRVPNLQEPSIQLFGIDSVRNYPIVLEADVKPVVDLSRPKGKNKISLPPPAVHYVVTDRRTLFSILPPDLRSQGVEQHLARAVLREALNPKLLPDPLVGNQHCQQYSVYLMGALERCERSPELLERLRKIPFEGDFLISEEQYALALAHLLTIVGGRRHGNELARTEPGNLNRVSKQLTSAPEIVAYARLELSRLVLGTDPEPSLFERMQGLLDAHPFYVRVGERLLPVGETRPLGSVVPVFQVEAENPDGLNDLRELILAICREEPREEMTIRHVKLERLEPTLKDHLRERTCYRKSPDGYQLLTLERESSEVAVFYKDGVRLVPRERLQLGS